MIDNLPLLTVVAVGAGLLMIVIAGLASFFGPKFEPRPLLNKSERRLYYMLRQELPHGWTVMAQVSYGAFLGNRSHKRYWTINAKRADLVVLDSSLTIAAVVEYQGQGHYGNSSKSRHRAKKSDRIKRRAVTEAGIAFLEVPPRFDRGLVQNMVRMVAGSGSRQHPAVAV